MANFNDDMVAASEGSLASAFPGDYVSIRNDGQIYAGGLGLNSSQTGQTMIARADGDGDDTGGAFLDNQWIESVWDASIQNTGLLLHCFDDGDEQAVLLASNGTGDGQLNIWRIDGFNNYTQITSNNEAITAGDVVRFEYVDGVYQFYINDVLQASTYSYTGHAGNGGSPGIHHYRNTSGDSSNTEADFEYLYGGDDFSPFAGGSTYEQSIDVDMEAADSYSSQVDFQVSHDSDLQVSDDNSSQADMVGTLSTDAVLEIANVSQVDFNVSHQVAQQLADSEAGLALFVVGVAEGLTLDAAKGSYISLERSVAEALQISIGFSSRMDFQTSTGETVTIDSSESSQAEMVATLLAAHTVSDAPASQAIYGVNIAADLSLDDLFNGNAIFQNTLEEGLVVADETGSAVAVIIAIDGRVEIIPLVAGQVSVQDLMTGEVDILSLIKGNVDVD